MKSGVLFWPEEGKVLASIRGSVRGQEKIVFSPEGEELCRTDVVSTEGAAARPGEVEGREYLLRDRRGEARLRAFPAYAPGEDPQGSGWPVCRAPRVDRARVESAAGRWELLMQNSQNYLLRDEGENPVAHILHRGAPGGWRIETSREAESSFLCAVFIFCRYLERENEFTAL